MNATTDDIHSCHSDLLAIYEEVMWLAARPGISASAARAWYTHVRADQLRRRIRRFTGMVSRVASTEHTLPLRLEHFHRLQTSLTQLVARHRIEGRFDPAEFARLIVECEQVHIVTVAENYAAMRARGDYVVAGIDLLPWSSLPTERQRTLWTNALRGRVANALDYRGDW